jgi:uncharacterized protein (TIGR02246 family)
MQTHTANPTSNTNLQPQDHERAEDRQAVQLLLQDMGQAWARGDAAAYAALLTEDSDYVVFDGTWLRGRAANVDQHQRLFDTILRGSRLVGEVEKIAFLGPDAALVHSVGAVIWPWQREPSPKARSRQTLVVVRQGGRWLARAFHNTRVRPLPPLRPGSLVVKVMMGWIKLRSWLAGAPVPACGPHPHPLPLRGRGQSREAGVGQG